MSRIKVYNTSTGQWEYADKAYSGGGVSSWNDLKDKPDMITPPAAASVGQTIVVKSVDENGKPTEWEAVDMPSGGGNSVSTKWELLNDIAVSEVVDSVVIDSDFDGNAISAKHMLVYMYLPKYDYDGITDTGYTTYAINGKSMGWGAGYCYESTGWDNGYFLFDIMGCGNLVYVRCYKNLNGAELINGRSAEIFHFIINENDGLYERINSFKWSLFNRKVLPGSTFKIYGEVV